MDRKVRPAAGLPRKPNRKYCEGAGTGRSTLHWFGGDGTEPSAVPIKAMRFNARVALIIFGTTQWSHHASERRRVRRPGRDPELGLA